MEEFRDMGNAVLADPRGQKQLPIAGVRLNQAFSNALDIETFEGGINLRLAEFRRRNHVPTMTMDDDGSKLVDAWVAERQVQAFNDALGMNSCTTSSWSRQDKWRHEEVEWDVPRQVKFPRHDQRDEDLGSGNATWQGQTPGLCISPEVQEKACKAADMEPRSQTPDVAVNSVALRLPPIKHPLYNQNAMASGYYPQEVLTKVGAGAKLMAAPKVAYHMYCGI